jgi:anti-anti-sigma factor
MRIVVNLSGLEVSDSGFVAGLVTLRKAVHAAGGRLVLCGPRPFLREILAYTRLDKFFEVFQRETDALDAFQPCRR